MTKIICQKSNGKSLNVELSITMKSYFIFVYLLHTYPQKSIQRFLAVIVYPLLFSLIFLFLVTLKC